MCYTNRHFTYLLTYLLTYWWSFYKIWRIYSWVYSGHSCSCISKEACVILLPETFMLLTTCITWLLVKWRKLDHSLVVAAISQWRRRLSASVRAHGERFEHILCRVTTCLKNLEMSGNSTAVREMSGILLKIRELSGKKYCQGKVA